MINEKKLIEEIKSLRVTITGLRAGRSVIAEFIKQYQASVLRIIDEQPQVDKWIPCSDGNVKRLPSKKGFYQVACEWEGKLEVYDLWYGDDGWMLDEDEGEVLQKVIAWQPLSQAYKKEGAE